MNLHHIEGRRSRNSEWVRLYSTAHDPRTEVEALNKRSGWAQHRTISESC